MFSHFIAFVINKIFRTSFCSTFFYTNNFFKKVVNFYCSVQIFSMKQIHRNKNKCKETSSSQMKEKYVIQNFYAHFVLSTELFIAEIHLFEKVWQLTQFLKSILLLTCEPIINGKIIACVVLEHDIPISGTLTFRNR